jgi:hypothetical protein
MNEAGEIDWGWGTLLGENGKQGGDDTAAVHLMVSFLAHFTFVIF